MPNIPVTTPFSYLGIFMILASLFLIMTGLGIIQIKDISVQAGRKTITVGSISFVVGLLFLVSDQTGLLPHIRPNADETSTATATLTPSPTDPTSPSATPALTEIPPPTENLPTPTPNIIATISAMQPFVSGFDPHGGWYSGTVDSDLTQGENTLDSGRLTLNLTAKGSVVYRDYGYTLKDFFASVDATLIETTSDPSSVAISLTWKDNHENKFYTANFYLDGFYEVMVFTGPFQSTTLIERTYSNAIQIQPGFAVRLGLLVVGSETTLFINNQALATVDDQTVTGAGAFGVGEYLTQKDDHMQVEFSQLTIIEGRE